MAEDPAVLEPGSFVRMNDAVGTEARSRSWIDPVLDVRLQEFEAGVHELTSVRGREAIRIARRLCELSREVMFLLGSPDQAPGELVARAVATFRKASEVLDGFPAELNVAKYARNITERAGSLQGKPGNVESNGN